MTHTAIQAEFPHFCAYPLKLCRICRWVLDHRGVAITNDIAPVAQTRAPTPVSGRHVGTPAVEGANENVPRSGPALLAETQPGAPLLLRSQHLSLTQPTMATFRIYGRITGSRRRT